MQIKFAFALGLFVIFDFVLDTSPRQNANKICFCARLIRIFAPIGQNCPTYLTNYRSNSLSYEKTVHFLGSHHPGAGGGSCSDSETDEFQNILIPQDNLSASISADALSHTIGFETTQSWTASVRETSRAESWISINPTSGDAGKHTITVTLTENETTESRQAVVIISCGGESANISITQRGVGQDEPEDPDNPNNPDNPQKPEHPDVAPEDRLTWVETTYTEVYSDGSSTDKSYMLFEYDAEGLLTGYDQYDYDSEQTDKINASYERTLKRSEGKITDEEKWFEIDGSSYEGMPLPNSGEYTKEYRLNTSGLVSSYTDPDGASQTFT